MAQNGSVFAEPVVSSEFFSDVATSTCGQKKGQEGELVRQINPYLHLCIRCSYPEADSRQRHFSYFRLFVISDFPRHQMGAVLME
jgi:hypothetical protein